MSRLLDRPADVHMDAAPQQLEYDMIARRLASDAPGRVLDWGAGIGQVTLRLRGLGLDVTAFDYRPGRPEPAIEPMPRFPDHELHVSPHPVQLPFDDDEFDAVLSCGVLEHVQDPDASLEEIKRVLRPGGTLYVYKLPNRFSYLEWIAKRAGLYYHGKLPDDAIYSKREAEDLLRRHGYAVRSIRRSNMFPLTLRSAAARRAAPAIFGAGRALARVPGLGLLATNVELVADAPR